MKENKKMSKGKKVLITVAIVVGLFFGIGLVGSIVAPDAGESVADTKAKTVVEDTRTPLEKVVDEADVKGLKITKDGSEIVAVFPVSDNMSNELIVSGARTDSKSIVGALENSDIKYSGLNITGTFDMVDQYGKEEPNMEVYYLYFPHKTIEKMHLDNLSNEAFVELADMEVIYPAFR